ncbi:MAG TPA: hypothetical protein VFY93_01535 [Planctomycetota bacterium]|nr:hypothetical protein [Planctomycetota bacterium]
MRASLFLVLAAACAGTPRPGDVPGTHAIYAGNVPPPLDAMAVLLVFSPPSEEGKTLVGRITSDATGEDFRPPLDTRVLELEPGRYRLETYYWVARSRMEDGKLLIENLRSGRIAPVEIVAEAGRTYWIRAEVRKVDDVPAEERGGFYELNYGEAVTDPDSMRRGESKFLAQSAWVWRPRLEALPPDKAKGYRSYR